MFIMRLAPKNYDSTSWTSYQTKKLLWKKVKFYTYQAKFELSDCPVFLFLLTEHLHHDATVSSWFHTWPVGMTLCLYELVMQLESHLWTMYTGYMTRLIHTYFEEKLSISKQAKQMKRLDWLP